MPRVNRKEWIRSGLEELAEIFALDVMSFAVLSNHLNIVVRTRPAADDGE